MQGEAEEGRTTSASLVCGEKFVREVDQAIARVVKNPLASPPFLSAMKCGVH
jgi:hypothetical protein